MIIRKLYRFESAHIVRDAVSQRCSHSFHGHSGVLEVFLKSEGLDKAGMIYDFGAFKKTIGSFVDMFDHSIHLWQGEKEEINSFFKKENERYVVLPCNPTAENYSLLFRDCINEILRESSFDNGEVGVFCSGVRYHETVTGYAESEQSDKRVFSIEQLIFSDKTLEETSEEIKKLISKRRMI